jgi:hypothetical protein
MEFNGRAVFFRRRCPFFNKLCILLLYNILVLGSSLKPFTTADRIATCESEEQHSPATCNRRPDRKSQHTTMDNNVASYNIQYFQDWMTELESTLKTSLNVDISPSFVEACRAAHSGHQSQRQAEKDRDQISKKNPPDKEEALAKANEDVTVATNQVNAAMERCRETAAAVLDQKDCQALLLLPDQQFVDSKDLMTYVLLQKGGAKDWADWCKGDSAQQLVDFLRHGDDLPRRFLQAGGARQGAYGPAVTLYHQLVREVVDDDEQQAVLERLAMAVALELCTPLKHFDSAKTVDPVQRFIHYKEAFLNGELDPAFETFTVWELRHVVNCDASNEELEWGRQSLMNFRPELVYLRDPQWRYCKIVKTNIARCTPDWYKAPKTYDQILSGGGKCGPKAWYGRFICKAFGIPTWGARQTGHAAVSSGAA